MLYLWVKAFHVLGVTLWIAGLLTALHLLTVASKAPAQSPEEFHRREGSVGRFLDAGSGLAILTGIWMLLQSLDLLRGAGFMHAKLTLVLGLLGLHGYVRAQLKRFRTGRGKSVPAALFPTVIAVTGVIIVLILVRPF
jgi:protoporphyrinogen IX oxidase